MVTTCISVSPFFIAVATFHPPSHIYNVPEVFQSIPNLFLSKVKFYYQRLFQFCTYDEIVLENMLLNIHCHMYYSYWT